MKTQTKKTYRVRGTKIPLSKKLHTAILQAVEDIQKVSKDDRFHINMGAYHSPNSGRCEVCFAGAVITRRLGGGLDVEENLDPYQFAPDVEYQLYALDSIRQGCIVEAIADWNQRVVPCRLKKDPPGWAIAGFRFYTAGFDRRMLKLADWLEKNVIYEEAEQ